MPEATPFVNLEKVARQLGKTTPFRDSFTPLEINVIIDFALEVESIVNRTLGLRLSDAVKTEYLPATGFYNNSDPDLEDFDAQGDKIIVKQKGVGSRILQLSHTPVLLADLEVWEDIGANGGQAANAFPASSKLVLGSDYYLDVSEDGISTSGVLIREAAVWSPYQRSIKVRYKGGPYAAYLNGTEAGLEAIDMAIAKAVAHNFLFWKRITTSQSPGGGLIASESTGKYSYSLGGPRGESGAEFGGFTVSIPDEIMASLSCFFNWGAIL